MDFMGRKWWLTVVSLLLLLVICVPAHATNFVDPDTPAGVQPLNLTGWNLTFSDEFEN
jgi:hypothetical protein